MAYIPPHLRHKKPKPTPAISKQTLPYVPPHLRLSNGGEAAPNALLSPSSSSAQHHRFSFRSSSDVVYRVVVLLPHEELSCQHVKFTAFEGETYSHLEHLDLYTLTPDLDPSKQTSTQGVEQIPRNPVNAIITSLHEDLTKVLEKLGRFTRAENYQRLNPSILLRFGRVIFHNVYVNRSKSCRPYFDWGSSYTPEDLERNFETRRLRKTFDVCLSMEEFVFLRELVQKDAQHIQSMEKIVIKVEDAMRPGSKLRYPCSRSKHNEQTGNSDMRDDPLEIMVPAKDAIEFDELMLHSVRHMIADVACVGKRFDIRLAFSTHEYLPELTEMELCDLKASVNDAYTNEGTEVHSDTDNEHSSSGRFQVRGKSCSIYTVVIKRGWKWYFSTRSNQVYVKPIICKEFCKGQKEWNTEKVMLSIEEILQDVWADCLI